VRFRPLLASLLGITFAALVPARAQADRSLDEYRHFRAVTIDLLGRMPTPEEVEAFEKPDFNLDAWVEQHLSTDEYADRVQRIYQDLLRLEPNPAINVGDTWTLYRKTLVGPDGKDVYVYYRKGQRRSRDETDADFCIPPAELTDEPGKESKKEIEAGKREQEKTRKAEEARRAREAREAKAAAGKGGKDGKGAAKAPEVKPPEPAGMMMGPPRKHVSRKSLDENTVLVRPWWLYKDHTSVAPKQRYKEGWQNPDPLFQPSESLLFEPDKTPTEEVRVCREEARPEPRGHIHVSGRAKPAPGEKPPFGREKFPPQDTGYALKHKGESIACTSRQALQSATDCGCGPGLERCMVSDAEQNGGTAFYFPLHAPLGIGEPLDDQRQPAGRWFALWWAQEAQQFLHHLFREDRDFREILTSRMTYVNGPLAQFYRALGPSSCCGAEAGFGMIEENEPLFAPANVPTDLAPQDVSRWERVVDRGPHAAGLLTMPIFLEKFASRRARGATLYTAFLCKSFSADTVELSPSTEPNLMIRPGCSTCHAALEPLAAYFSRVEETNWVFLPPKLFPIQNPACKNNAQGKSPNGDCNTFYDPDFSSPQAGFLRGAYASEAHANEGLEGAGRDITASPDFARCAAQRVTASFLGRPLTPDDQALLGEMTDTFTRNGFRVKPLVKAILKSPTYARANNLSSSTWRAQQP
jgi:hypothetical protein